MHLLQVALHYSKEQRMNIRYFSLGEVALDVHITVNRIKDILYKAVYEASNYVDNRDPCLDPFLVDHEFIFQFDSNISVHVTISGIYMNSLNKAHLLE